MVVVSIRSSIARLAVRDAICAGDSKLQFVDLAPMI